MVLENNNYKIELVEEYPCENSEQLRAREAFHFSKIECVNSNRPYVDEFQFRLEQVKSAIERRKNNPEKYKEYNKKWRERNPEQVRELDKKYRVEVRSIPIICECGSTTSKQHLSRHLLSKIHTKKISSKCIDQNATPTQENTQTEIV
jgi:hypothetical protein